MNRKAILYEIFSHAESEVETTEEDLDDVFGDDDEGWSLGTRLKGAVSSLWSRKASGNDTFLEDSFKLSPNGQSLVLLHGHDVVFLSKEDDFDSVRYTFRGEKDQAEILRFAAWSEGSDYLLVASLRSIHILDAKGERSFVRHLPSRWLSRGALTGVALLSPPVPGGPAAEVLLLFSNASAKRLLLDEGEEEEAPAKLLPVPSLTLPTHHCTTLALVHDPARSALLVVGDTPLTEAAPARPKKAEGAEAEVASPAKAPRSASSTVSAWRIVPSSEGLAGSSFGLVAASGKPAAAAAPAKGAVPALQSAKQLEAVRISASPEFGRLAVVGPLHTLEVFKLDLEKGVCGRARLKEESFGPREAVSGEPARALLFSRAVKHQAEQVTDVAWWAEDTLVVVGAGGEVWLALLPELCNLLGASPEVFSPGMRAARGGDGRALLLERVVSEDAPAEDDADDDDAKQDSPKKKPPGWRVISLNECTVTEMYQGHIASGEYGLALNLARNYGLDCDEVYKARWRAGEVGKAEANDNLPRITDKLWVLNECVTRVAKSGDAQRALLLYGLKETSTGRPTETFTEEELQELKEAAADKEAAGASPGSPEPAEELLGWRHRYRLQLWQYLDRLDTLLSIHHGTFHTEAFAAFCDAPLPLAAVQFAQGGHLRAVELLLRRHPAALASHRLQILAAFPATVEMGPARPWWNALRLASATEHMVRGAGSDAKAAHTTEEDVARWYQETALRLDGASGLLDHSMALLQLGAERLGDSDKTKGLQKLMECTRCLQAGLAHLPEVGADVDEAASMTLEEFAEMTAVGRADFMTAFSRGDNVVEHLRDETLSMLQRAGAEQ
eukprot:gene5683-6869_t